MKKIISLFIFVLIAFCFFHFGCKSSTELFTLTVITNDGISGFPETGTYTYEKNSMVFYNYETMGAYENPRIMLDNKDLPINGTITMDKNYTLTVTCDNIDYNGDWLGTYTWRIHNWAMCSRQPDDAVDDDVYIEHSGESISIAFPSLGLEFRGSLTSDGFFWLKDEKKISDDTLYEYILHGSFLSATEFNADFEITGYRLAGNMREGSVCGSRGVCSGTKK